MQYRIEFRMMKEEISVYMAFAAGLLSFLSPCVLPLIPSYLGILGGFGLGGTAQIPESRKPGSFRYRLIPAAMAFVLGFTAIFIILGLLVSTTFLLMGGIMTYVNLAAGIIVIVLGLNVIFDFLKVLNYEKRPQFAKFMKGGVPGAFIAGAAFATGWTPCIGPILTAILFTAGQSGKTGRAVLLLLVYSAGLALPFLLAALFFDSFLKHGSRLGPYLPRIKRISGILLVIIGIMILGNQFSVLSRVIQKSILNYIEWAQTSALPFRVLANWLEWLNKF